ncbi:MAG: RdgB/HAM1 family non-canonical purine NTP pyrophosphatase [Bacteroidetes bacterium]|nr:RdgB/HAM1 family non-canonical purine NTP pyrophosphatase [Bacteroidota bacterium]
MKLVFASSNENKITEVRQSLTQNVSLLGLMDIGINYEIPETGKTISENSYIKALHVHQFLLHKNLPHTVFADDSGLEVSALNNEPGVYSARYAGLEKNDALNNEKLLHRLKHKNDRKARFVTVITLILNGSTYVFEGLIHGQISTELKGSNGFGYDPLFIPNGYNKTFAELSFEIKNKISHRAIAIKKLNDFLVAQKH